MDNSGERSQAAAKIIHYRTELHPYQDVPRVEENRDGQTYLKVFHGLQHFLKEAIALQPEKPLVIDVGTGQGKGISQVLDMLGLTDKVTLIGTSLRYNETLMKQLANVRLTGVETLRGIQDSSVAAMLGLNSVAHSGSLTLAARSIDRVLKPGGLFKMTFVKEFSDFVDYLKSMGYDLQEVADTNTRLTILLGRKPFPEKKMKSARVLFLKDHDSMYKQLAMGLDKK
ncbi:MAG TPA: hypothetical protein VF209_05230 [Patescibacteria group bacterium]